MRDDYRRTYARIKHLDKPNPWVYWFDLLLTAVAAYGLMSMAFNPESNSWLKWVCFAGSVFFVNRGIYLMHESFHQRNRLKGYELAQNILFGCVFKYPSYIHMPHHHHHSATTYGTSDDPEYDGSWIGNSTLKYLSVIPVAAIFPLVQLIRFGVIPALLPLSFLFGQKGKRFRQHVYEKASTFAMNPAYVRPPYKDSRELLSWMFQDTLCFLFTMGSLYLLFSGKLSFQNFLLLNLYSSIFFLFNFLRALVAHRYFSTGERMTIEDQLEDSISIPNSALGFFWAPVGLKYHSLHHYLPTLPYHNLRKAHRILVKLEGASYLRSLEPSLQRALLKAFKGGAPRTDSASVERDTLDEKMAA